MQRGQRSQANKLKRNRRQTQSWFKRSENILCTSKFLTHFLKPSHFKWQLQSGHFSSLFLRRGWSKASIHSAEFPGSIAKTRLQAQRRLGDAGECMRVFILSGWPVNRECVEERSWVGVCYKLFPSWWRSSEGVTTDPCCLEDESRAWGQSVLQGGARVWPTKFPTSTNGQINIFLAVYPGLSEGNYLWTMQMEIQKQSGSRVTLLHWVKMEVLRLLTDQGLPNSRENVHTPLERVAVSDRPWVTGVEPQIQQETFAIREVDGPREKKENAEGRERRGPWMGLIWPLLEGFLIEINLWRRRESSTVGIRGTLKIFVSNTLTCRRGAYGAGGGGDLPAIAQPVPTMGWHSPVFTSRS